MERFIWADNEHVVNLDAVAYFKVDTGSVKVQFRDSGVAAITIEGDRAVALADMLQRGAQTHQSAPITLVFPDLPGSQQKHDAVVEIDDLNAPRD